MNILSDLGRIRAVLNKENINQIPPMVVSDEDLKELKKDGWVGERGGREILFMGYYLGIEIYAPKDRREGVRRFTVGRRIY